MRSAIAVALLALSFTTASMAQQDKPAAAGSASTPQVLEAVTVTGVRPGPGLWKVSKNGHVMWVLGTLKPLPRGMQWQSDEVTQKLASSQQLLEAPSIPVKVDTGFFGKLFLLPSAYAARKNPDGQTLQQILPEPMYARWLPLEKQYFGNDSSPNEWRPIYAARELYSRALDKANLTAGNDVGKTVLRLADQLKVQRVPVKYTLEIEHPRDAIKTIKQTNLHDLSCFNQTLDTVQNGMPALTQRANAWAVGDVQALRGENLSDRQAACIQAVVDASFAESLGIKNVPQQLNAMWLTAAQAALARNAQTFALLPMNQVLDADGLLAQLKARGYQVEAPDEDPAPPAASP